MPTGPLARMVMAAAVGAAHLCVAPAYAQTRLDAKYVVTLASLKIGEGSWSLDVREDRFKSEASGLTSGMARIFNSGQGTTVSQGAIKNGVLVPSSYGVTVKWGKRSEDLRMKLSDGAVNEVTIVPPPPPEHPNRVKVTDAHRRNVLDPMTGSILRVQGTGDLMAPEVCRQHAGIFDGRMRYDLTLAYKRIEQVKIKGYSGPALVCAIYFAPLAGHVPDRPAIKYLINQRDMETWLVPLPGTRVMVPVKVVVPTPLGEGLLLATEFNTGPLPSRAGVKTH